MILEEPDGGVFVVSDGLATASFLLSRSLGAPGGEGAEEKGARTHPRCWHRRRTLDQRAGRDTLVTARLLADAVRRPKVQSNGLARNRTCGCDRVDAVWVEADRSSACANAPPGRAVGMERWQLSCTEGEVRAVSGTDPTVAQREVVEADIFLGHCSWTLPIYGLPLLLLQALFCCLPVAVISPPQWLSSGALEVLLSFAGPAPLLR